MPFVANPREPTADLVGELLAELARPLQPYFLADDDAAVAPPCVDRVASGNTATGMADVLFWEPISGVAGASGFRHPTRLLTGVAPHPGKTRQVDGAAGTSSTFRCLPDASKRGENDGGAFRYGRSWRHGNRSIVGGPGLLPSWPGHPSLGSGFQPGSCR
jgi:hypothetical protein